MDADFSRNDEKTANPNYYETVNLRLIKTIIDMAILSKY